jgi:hypothetical protein
MGEGWHNNHHYYMSVRQGIRWWKSTTTLHPARAVLGPHHADLRPWRVIRGRRQRDFRSRRCHLSRIDDVVIFERESRLGGTRTHHLDTPDARSRSTRAFVHNDRTYPLLVRLFDEIGVETLRFRHVVRGHRSGDWLGGTRNLNNLFADRRNS